MTTLTNTDAFDARLVILDRSGRKDEATAAIEVYERLKTARSIAESLLATHTSADVVALMLAISAEGTKMTVGSRS